MRKYEKIISINLVDCPAIFDTEDSAYESWDLRHLRPREPRMLVTFGMSHQLFRDTVIWLIWLIPSHINEQRFRQRDIGKVEHHETFYLSSVQNHGWLMISSGSMRTSTKNWGLSQSMNGNPVLNQSFFKRRRCRFLTRPKLVVFKR